VCRVMMSAVDGSLMIGYMRYGSVSLRPASQPRAGPHTCRPFMITRSLSSLIDFDVQRPTSNLQDLVHDPDTVLILTLIHRTTDHGPRTHDTAVQRTHERTTRARNRTWRGAGRRDRRATRIANAPQENINSPQRRERPRPSRPARRPGCAGTANASRQSSHHTRQTGAALSRVRPPLSCDADSPSLLCSDDVAGGVTLSPNVATATCGRVLPSLALALRLRASGTARTRVRTFAARLAPHVIDRDARYS
jgi:hypothetical protein